MIFSTRLYCSKTEGEPKFCGCKTTPNHQSSTTVLEWHAVFDVCIVVSQIHFGLICKKDIGSEALWFVTQVWRWSMVFVKVPLQLMVFQWFLYNWTIAIEWMVLRLTIVIDGMVNGF